MEENKNPERKIIRASMDDFANVCGSCKFYDNKSGLCKERNIEVAHKTPKCDKWRYFA